MASIKSKVPKLRFKGFSGEWNNSKLQELINIVSGNDGRKNLPILTISAASGWMSQQDRFSQVIAGKELQNYTLLKKGELSYNRGNSKLAKYGVVFSLKSYNEALVPRVYHSFKIKQHMFSQYIEYLFLSKKTDRELGKLVSSSARMDGLLNISVSSFVSISIFYPNLKEQTQIGHFFQKLDQVIERQQHALTQAQNYKKAMLQKMFPQKGEKVPKVRFKGFSGNWVKKKLEECFDERNERAESGELISVTINSGVVLASSLERRDTSSSDKSNYKMVCIGDIAYNSMRMWQGASGLSNYTGVLSPAYTVIIPKNNISGLFFSYQFKLPFMINMFRNNSQGLTSDTWNLKFPLLKEISVKIPSLKEQTQIGNFFQQLDKQITEQQNKLTYYQTLKKAMLQRLFI